MSARFPSSVYALGVEPDPRFSLANERTFLAWIRTSLALLAVGVGLAAVDLPMHEGLQVAAAGVVLVTALAAALWSWFGWAGAERALRNGGALPGSGIGLALVGLLIVVCLLLVLALLLGG